MSPSCSPSAVIPPRGGAGAPISMPAPSSWRCASAPAVRLHAIHAGDPEEPALADYLGMGLATLTVLKQPRDADVLPALASHLRP